VTRASAPTGARRLVLASGNHGKLAELRALLAPLQVQVEPQAALGVSEAEEPHPTFLENALAKARHAARATGWPALADDSGLCCRALDGAPGVRSARFAGVGAGDAANNARLLQRLREPAAGGERAAEFVSVVVALRGPEDPEPLVADGRWAGLIVDAARGAGGFGYDPHFLVPALGATAAELPAEQKNRLSHRAQAMRVLLALLRERWGW
jgi:XTP/dITP diphosphohydrolase